MAACPGDLVLANTTVPDTETFESCATIHAGPELTVAPTGGLTLRAADRIVFDDGFQVESGGTPRRRHRSQPRRRRRHQDLRLPGLRLLPDRGHRPVGEPELDLRQDRQPPHRDRRRRHRDLPLRRNERHAAAKPHRPPDQHRPRHPRHPQLRLHRRRPRRLRHRRRQRRRLRLGRRRPPRAVDEPERHQPLPLRRPRLPALGRRRRHRRHRHPDLRLLRPPPQPLREPAGGPARRYTIFYLAGRPVAQLATETGQTRPLVVPHHRPPRHPHRRHRRRPGHPLDEPLRALR